MKKLPVLLLLFFLPFSAFAAITVDATANGGGGTTASSQSWNHVISGANTLIVVSCEGNLFTAGSNVTGATDNGVAMNQVGTGFNGGNATNNVRYSYLFYLINPTPGTNTILVSGSASSFFDCASASYDGVKQTGQPDQTNLGQFALSNTANTFAVTTTNAPWSIFAFSPRCTTVTFTALVQRSTGDANGGGDNAGVYDSNGPSASSVGFTCSSGDIGQNAIMATFDPAPAPFIVPPGVQAVIQGIQMLFLRGTTVFN